MRQSQRSQYNNQDERKKYGVLPFKIIIMIDCKSFARMGTNFMMGVA
jgi:hypothetical protein